MGDFFNPDYEKENKILSEFKKDSPELNQLQIDKLIDVLENEIDLNKKFFVTDLLYLYDRVDEKIFEPLINIAIDYQDPSFNRIFLRPCMQLFGVKKVSEKLKEKFINASLKDKIGISQLVYWLRPKNKEDAQVLEMEIINRANETDNLIELYFYNLNYSNKIKSKKRIPTNANELMNVVNGNSELEYVLYDQLKRKRLTKKDYNSLWKRVKAKFSL